MLVFTNLLRNLQPPIIGFLCQRKRCRSFGNTGRGRTRNGCGWVNTITIKASFVFAQDNGQPLHPDSVTDWMKKFSKRHGLPHINPHAFRHTMASLLYFNGVDSVLISKRLGHAQVSTTCDIYSHVIAEADQRNADILGDIFLKKA